MIVRKDKYVIYDALNPFFGILMEGLAGLVDGEHFFETIEASHGYFASNRDRALFTCSQFIATQSTKPCIGRSRLFASKSRELPTEACSAVARPAKNSAIKRSTATLIRVGNRHSEAPPKLLLAEPW